MTSLVAAAAFAIFIWWFSTGIVLLLNGMQRHAYRWSLALSSLLGLAAPGLHLGVREGDRYVDPALLFSARPRHARLVPVGP